MHYTSGQRFYGNNTLAIIELQVFTNFYWHVKVIQVWNGCSWKEGEIIVMSNTALSGWEYMIGQDSP